MKIAKAEITNKKIFNEIKAALDQNSYVECSFCGAIRVEAIELARAVNSLIDRSENANDDLNDLYYEILGAIIESVPEEINNSEEYQKWEASNERPVYDFLDDYGYISKMYGSYDELIIYYDSNCDCFGKEKINYEIVID
ncbi:hypothetical protein ASZ90_007764 [hydrocarbon metagenome]|uniref:Uncharacterized protein n=1 Tax=hydrocarbon metagenome TaxID=938273 RepID=A0A0W8FNI1_9ZZZZ